MTKTKYFRWWRVIRRWAEWADDHFCLVWRKL